MYGKKSSLMLKGNVYKSYGRPTIMRGSEVWCMMGNEMAIFDGQRSMVRVMCGVLLNDGKRADT